MYLPGFESIQALPAGPGSYALHMALHDALCIATGRLGDFLFPAGDYFYLGSANGPGGLRARIRHHALAAKRPHWHLDWLRPHTILLGGWFAPSRSALECVWSQALASLPGAVIPAPGFGASDCRGSSPAHLIAFPPAAGLVTVEARLSGSGIFLQRFTFTRGESGEKVE